MPVEFKLAAFQEKFVDAVLNGEGEAVIANIVKPAGRLNPKEVINVYRQDYFARLSEALGETFGAVWAVLGDDDFHQLCRDYIKQHPSIFKDLGHYGNLLALYLKQTPHHEDFPWISDLAQFEWDFWEIFHAAENLKRDAFEGIDETHFANIKIEFAAMTKLYAWDTSLYSIWRQRDDAEALGEVETESFEAVCLYKDGVSVGARTMTRAEHGVFDSLIKGATIAEALSSWGDEDPQLLPGLFSFLRQSGIVSKVVF
jgi:hypothetical protein